MADNTNICMFGIEKVGKSCFISQVTPGDFTEDYMPTQQRSPVEYTVEVDGTTFHGNFQDEPGSSFTNTKTTTSTFGASGMIHLFVVAADNEGSMRFAERFVDEADYADFKNNEYLQVMIVTKKDLKAECFGDRPQAFATKVNGLSFTLDLQDKAAVDECFKAILKAYGDRKGYFGKGGKKAKAPKEGKGKEGAQQKKGGCTLL